MTNKSDNLDGSKGFLGQYSKYRTLAILVAAFLTLTTALALLTVYSAERFARATDELEIITRQSLISYRISENLTDVHTAIQGSTQSVNTDSPTAQADNTIAISTLPKQTQDQLKQLEQLIQTFDTSVSALQNGGDVAFADTTINTDGLTSSQMLPMVEKITSSWQTHRKPFQKFVQQTRTGQINTQTLNELVEYTRLHSGEINSDIASMRQALNTLIQDQTILVKRVQFIAILIAFGVFLAIVFGALRRLRQTDEELLVAQRQTDDIMQTINEGLFLIDKDLIIADKYSGKLEDIMQQKNLAGRSLYDVLRGMISQKDMDTLKLFVEQLYNPWVVEELIKDLNPLQQVLVSYIDDKQLSHTKFLKFNFLRVLDNDQENIKNVFVSVTDITTEVRLQNQLEKDKEQHDRQIATISYLLTVDEQQLNRFIQQTKDRIERMNNILKIHNTDNLSGKVNQLYREIHSLKGDASAMKLGNIVDIAEKQENLLKSLHDKFDLKGNDFLPFTVGLDELIRAITFIEDLMQRLNLSNNTALKSAMSANNTTVASVNHKPNHDATNDASSFFTNYANDIAQRQGKQVQVSIQGFESLNQNDDVSTTCKDIAMQLLKNAIVHGIEAPEQRLANQKTQVGHINLSLLPTDDGHKLYIRDDGQGINWAKLRQKAVEKGLVSADNAQNLTQRDLLKFMFSSGFSTADHQDEDAGRGVGMDIIHQLTLNLNGKISINSQQNQFTEISITFPNIHI